MAQLYDEHGRIGVSIQGSTHMTVYTDSTYGSVNEQLLNVSRVLGLSLNLAEQSGVCHHSRRLTYNSRFSNAISTPFLSKTLQNLWFSSFKLPHLCSLPHPPPRLASRRFLVHRDG